MGTAADRFVLTDAAIIVNDIDLSDHLDTVAVGPFTTGAAPAAAMGDPQDFSAPQTRKVAFNATFFQDFAASKVHATLMPLWSDRTIFDLIVKTTNAAASATNPWWSGKVFVSSYQPWSDGKRGAEAMAPVTFEPAGLITELQA